MLRFVRFRIFSWRTIKGKVEFNDFESYIAYIKFQSFRRLSPSIIYYPINFEILNARRLFAFNDFKE